MARSSLKLRFRETLRPFPFVHQIAKAFQRFTHQAACDLLRLLSPRSSYLALPKGFYSGVIGVRDGDANGEVILESQTCPPFPSDSLVKLSRLGQDTHQPWPVFWMEIPDAFLCGRSLVPRDSCGLLLAEATFSQTGDRTDPSFSHIATGSGETITGNATSLVSRWGGDTAGNRRYGGAGYWHWLFDSVSRLSLLDRFPPDTRVITPRLEPWMRWYLERLDLGGRIIETDATALTVEHFYFSSPSSMTGCWNPYAVDFLRRSFLPHASPRPTALPKRFYIIRDGYTRGVVNEMEVREFFASRGWALIAPEKHSIPDQIALFRDAEAIAGLHGSAFTNLLWCLPGTSVLELVPENFMAGAFEWLARINGPSHRFLVCPVDRAGNARVDLAELGKHLPA
jgi:Glycosyltransferase 61